MMQLLRHGAAARPRAWAVTGPDDRRHAPEGPPQRPRWRPGGFTLGLLFAGLTTSLLALAEAALIAGPPVEAGPAPGCVAFQVGSPHAADTHLHLENAGPGRAAVRLEFVDHDGRDPQAVGWNPILEPGASADFVFRTPALGTAVKLVAPGEQLRAGAAIIRDDGTPPEIRRAVGCLAESEPRRINDVAP